MRSKSRGKKPFDGWDVALIVVVGGVGFLILLFSALAIWLLSVIK